MLRFRVSSPSLSLQLNSGEAFNGTLPHWLMPSIYELSEGISNCLSKPAIPDWKAKQTASDMSQTLSSNTSFRAHRKSTRAGVDFQPLRIIILDRLFVFVLGWQRRSEKKKAVRMWLSYLHNRFALFSCLRSFSSALKLFWLFCLKETILLVK